MTVRSSRNERSNNYSRIVYVLNDIRLIRCRDNLQWITQYYRGGYWRSRSYHTEIGTIHRDEPMLDLQCLREAIALDANKRLMQSQIAQRVSTGVL